MRKIRLAYLVVPLIIAILLIPIILNTAKPETHSSEIKTAKFGLISDPFCPPGEICPFFASTVCGVGSTISNKRL